MASDEGKVINDSNLYDKAVGLDVRGRHATFGKALDAVLVNLQGEMAEKNDFFDSLADRWPVLFPTLKAVPGRYEDGIIFLYVRSAPLLYSVRSRLASIRAKLAALPGAPKRLTLRLEIHAQ